MSRVLYIDCIGGVAGDMLLGALLDAGADIDGVRDGLARLGIDDLSLETEPAVRHGIAGTRAIVRGNDTQPHRAWRSIRELEMPELAQEAFRRLAIAEGRIHGIDPERVHFHEVGAIDAIGEIVGVALALESLGIDRVACSPLPAGRGFVRAAHGRLPLPAPATLELLRGAPLRGVELEAELVTPTGAALVASLAESFGPLPALRLEATGYGAGARDHA